MDAKQQQALWIIAQEYYAAAELCAQQVGPYSAGWGYYPGGGLGLILLVLIVLIVDVGIDALGIAAIYVLVQG
jgi:hypothetical protein